MTASSISWRCVAEVYGRLTKRWELDVARDNFAP